MSIDTLEITIEDVDDDSVVYLDTASYTSVSLDTDMVFLHVIDELHVVEKVS